MSSNDIAITVRGLGKCYSIRQNQRKQSTLTEAIVHRVRHPFQSTPAEIFWAVRDLTFEVKRGEVLGIIGRNGAGKSTLLKLLSRITRPTSGEAFMYGRVGSLLEVGAGFHSELTGRENIYLNGAILGMSRGELNTKLDAIVAFAGVEKFLDTPVKRYSSGMYVRLAFAVAAHLEPDILIVDEVLAVGDAEFQKKCMGKMSEIAGAGRTVLFVSHNMQAVTQLCSKALVMTSGTSEHPPCDVSVAIGRYNSLIGSHVIVEWRNKGNEFSSEYFNPIRMFIGDDSSRLTSGIFTTTDTAWLYVQCVVPRFDPALQLGFEIFTESGELLFMSFSTDQDERQWPIRCEGDHFLRVPLPLSDLNEGSYRIELSVGLRWRGVWLCTPGSNAPVLHFELRRVKRTSPYWVEKRPGTLAPLLNWEMAHLTETNR